MSFWIVSLLLLSLILCMVFCPISLGKIESHPNPATNYEQALARVKAMQDEDDQGLARDVAVTKLYDHGTQTEHAIILLHGFTTCPEQFNELGKQ